MMDFFGRGETLAAAIHFFFVLSEIPFNYTTPPSSWDEVYSQRPPELGGTNGA